MFHFNPFYMKTFLRIFTVAALALTLIGSCRQKQEMPEHEGGAPIESDQTESYEYENPTVESDTASGLDGNQSGQKTQATPQNAQEANDRDNNDVQDAYKNR